MYTKGAPVLRARAPGLHGIELGLLVGIRVPVNKYNNPHSILWGFRKQCVGPLKVLVGYRGL